MNNLLSSKVTTVLLIVLINVAADHFWAPLGIIITPFVLAVAAGVVAFWPGSLNPLEQSLLTFLAVALNDLGIKLLGGGSLDQVGLAWIQMFMLIGLVPAFVLLVVGIIKNSSSTWAYKATGLFIFPVLVGAYVYILQHVGFAVPY